MASNIPPRFATPKPKPVSTSTTTEKPTTERPIDKDHCRPACNLSNKEICKELNDGIFKCDCRPGFAKKANSNICEGMKKIDFFSFYLLIFKYYIVLIKLN